MRPLSALLLLAQLSAADVLEIRQVVEAGKGAKTYEDPWRKGAKLAVSDTLLVGDRHLAEVLPARELGQSALNGKVTEKTWGLSVTLTAEGHERIIAATKGGKEGGLRLALVIDGKLKRARGLDSVPPLGRNIPIITDTLEEAKELAEKLQAAMEAAKKPEAAEKEKK